MKIIKDLFARVWALWGIVSFLSTFLIIIIPSMCAYLFRDEKKGQTYFITLSRIWMRIWLTLMGCPLRIKGLEHFTKGKNYIVIFNHSSTLDIPLSCPFTPGANKTIGKSSLSKIPVFGWFYKRGTVLVDRKSENSRRKSYEQMKMVLKKGMHMCIYPEGTRNRTDEPLKQFYDGAFKLSVDTGIPIIPCIIGNTRKVMPMNKSFYFLPATLTLDFLPPVEPGDQAARELNNLIHGIMLKKIVENN